MPAATTPINPNVVAAIIKIILHSLIELITSISLNNSPPIDVSATIITAMGETIPAATAAGIILTH